MDMNIHTDVRFAVNLCIGPFQRHESKPVVDYVSRHQNIGKTD